MPLKHVLGVSEVNVGSSEDFCCAKLYLLFCKSARVQCNVSAFAGWLMLTLSPFQNFCLSAKGCIVACKAQWLQNAHVEKQNFSTWSLQQHGWVAIPHHGQTPNWGT